METTFVEKSPPQISPRLCVAEIHHAYFIGYILDEKIYKVSQNVGAPLPVGGVEQVQVSKTVPYRVAIFAMIIKLLIKSSEQISARIPVGRTR